jgi:hypothetical protein
MGPEKSIPFQIYLFKFTCCNNLNAWALHSQPCPQAPTQTRTKRRSNSKRLGTRLLHSQKRPRLAASCGLTGLLQVVNRLQQVCWHLQTWWSSSLQMSTCSKPDRTTCSKSDERINADTSWEIQACCKLSFADLMLVVSSTCIKSVDIKFWLVWWNINVDASWENQACCKLLSAGLMQVIQTIYRKLAASCSNNLQQACG